MPERTVTDFSSVEREAPAMLDELFYKGMQVLEKRLAS
jgi:hypothetical protein